MTYTLLATNSTDASAVAPASTILAFTSGIDSTYKIYEFHIYNAHAGDYYGKQFSFNGSDAGGVSNNYSVTKTTTHFATTYRYASRNFYYNTSYDQAQSTWYPGQIIGAGVGGMGYLSDADSLSGKLTIYDPASSFVTNFMSETVLHYFADGVNGGGAIHTSVGGYFNTTDAIDAIKFEMNGVSGGVTVYDGTVKMFGVS